MIFDISYNEAYDIATEKKTQISNMKSLMNADEDDESCMQIVIRVCYIRKII